MGLIKLTFDGSLNTAKQDAVFNHYLTSGVNGIFKDIGHECSASISSSKIIFQDGYVQAVGRRVYVENNTSIDISLDGTANGIIVIRVNTLTDEATLEKLEKSGDGGIFPTLNQSATISEDGIYELPIFYYRKTASSLSKVTDKTIPYILKTSTTINALSLQINNVNHTLTSKIDSKISELTSKIESKKQNITTSILGSVSISKSGSGNTYSFNLPTTASYYLISFFIKENFITLPSLSITSSNYSLNVNYRFVSQDFKCEISHDSSNKIYIKTGHKEHYIGCIYITY